MSLDKPQAIPLFLFAKAPIAGKVKTRLQSHCSAQQAADIAEILLEATVQRVCESWPGRVFISIWLDSEHPCLIRIAKRFDVPIVVQRAGDLGAKMQATFSDYGYPAAIIGCDAPHTTSETLTRLYQNLLKGVSSIGPSVDGGYYVIGLCESAEYLFENMPWGSDLVLAKTLNKASDSEFTIEQLDKLQDVDEWNDVLAVKDLLPELARYLIDQDLL